MLHLYPCSPHRGSRYASPTPGTATEVVKKRPSPGGFGPGVDLSLNDLSLKDLGYDMVGIDEGMGNVDNMLGPFFSSVWSHAHRVTCSTWSPSPCSSGS